MCHLHVYICARMNVCICIYVYYLYSANIICLHTCMYTCVCVYACLCVCVCVCEVSVLKLIRYVNCCASYHFGNVLITPKLVFATPALLIWYLWLVTFLQQPYFCLMLPHDFSQQPCFYLQQPC
jgi:hypothetical protein